MPWDWKERCVLVFGWYSRVETKACHMVDTSPYH